MPSLDCWIFAKTIFSSVERIHDLNHRLSCSHRQTILQFHPLAGQSFLSDAYKRTSQSIRKRLELRPNSGLEGCLEHLIGNPPEHFPRQKTGMAQSMKWGHKNKDGGITIMLNSLHGNKFDCSKHKPKRTYLLRNADDEAIIWYDSYLFQSSHSKAILFVHKYSPSKLTDFL